MLKSHEVIAAVEKELQQAEVKLEKAIDVLWQHRESVDATVISPEFLRGRLFDKMDSVRNVRRALQRYL